MNTVEPRLCIKVCPDPGCEAVYHNVPKKHTKCIDCGGNVIEINQSTWRKKFGLWFFQYDYSTLTDDGRMEFLRPSTAVQLELF